jgi:transposase
MQVVVQRGAGLDVHKKTVVASVQTPEASVLRTYGTMTGQLREMGRWLESQGVTVVAMESTGPYWKPVYNVLEEFGFELVVCNAQHIKAVPGRKTDVKDAEWICDLVRHGLIQPSFIPSKAERERRELTRYRRRVIQERAREVNRIQKVLEGANIKLGSVATDVMGVSGRQMIEAMITGTDDPKVLAAMAKGRLKNKQDDLEQALVGMVGAHQRLILSEMLGHIDELDARIARLDKEVAERLDPFQTIIARLDGITGIGLRAAQDILAEITADMSRFPTAAHLASWARLCPGNNESAGKRRTGKTGKGNVWLRAALVEAARAAARSKGTYLGAQYHRIAARRGAKRAAVAVAHTILVAIYHMIKRGTDWQDLGADYYDRRNKQATVRRLVKRLEGLGCHVTVDDVA